MRALVIAIASIPMISHAVPTARRCAAIPNVVHQVDCRLHSIGPAPRREATALRWRFETERVDLDGDGELDALVPAPPLASSGPRELRWRVIVMRNGCAVELGTIGPGDVTSATAGRIEIVDESPARTTSSRYVIVGDRLVLVWRTSTDGCDHCPRGSCVAAE